jgi:hypothetical protein
MTVELDGDTLAATATTGNKQWVAVITDTHPKYNYDRDFVAYQKPKTSDRDSGTATVDPTQVLDLTITVNWQTDPGSGNDVTLRWTVLNR